VNASFCPISRPLFHTRFFTIRFFAIAFHSDGLVVPNARLGKHAPQPAV
jgi:hypothetical protein